MDGVEKVLTWLKKIKLKPYVRNVGMPSRHMWIDC
jgi:hypothetical protein